MDKADPDNQIKTLVLNGISIEFFFNKKSHFNINGIQLEATKRSIGIEYSILK